MSSTHFLLSDILNDLYRPSRSIYDQHFDLGLVNEDISQPRLMSVPLHSGYLRPWRHLSTGESGVSSFEHDKSSFKVSLGVQQFKPDQISVKVVDNFVVVEAKHEELEDKHGFVSRQFKRRYIVPDGILLDGLKSTLSSDGVLTLTAPRKEVQHSEGRSIPIIRTNEPALKNKAESKEDAE